MHLPGRPAGIGQHGGEAAERPEDDAGQRVGARARRSKRLPSQCRSTKAPAISPIASRIWAADSDAANKSAIAIPTAMLGNHDLQVPGAPVAPIGPDGQRVLRQHRRQQDRGGLHRRHRERHQRQRHHAEPEEAAFRQPEQAHADDRRRARTVGRRARSIRCRREARGEGAARHKSAGARRAPASCRMAELPRPTRLANSACGFTMAPQATALIRERRERHGCPHQPLSRGLWPLAARPGGLLGRGRRRHRLDRAGQAGVRSRAPASTAAGSSAASATPAGTRSTAT